MGVCARFEAKHISCSIAQTFRFLLLCSPISYNIFLLQSSPIIIPWRLDKITPFFTEEMSKFLQKKFFNARITKH